MIDMSIKTPPGLPVEPERPPSMLSKIGLLLLCIQAATGTWTAYRVGVISAHIEEQSLSGHEKDMAIYASDERVSISTDH